MPPKRSIADKEIIRNFQSSTYPAWLFAFLGAGAFIIHLWTNARTQESVIDEGLYLMKGLLFTSGRYTPFQDGGPWTNHMPASFFIPGWVQQIFEPGLRTGRYYAIILGMLFIIGLWIVSRRLGGNWLAAISIWILAINPSMVKNLSQAASQGLILVLFVWMLVFMLGKDRSTWQILTGAMLAGIMLMTRLNMAAVLPLVVVYTFWEHGRKKGWIAAITGLLVVSIGHALFWPEILKIWVYWLPPELTTFLDYWRDSSVEFSLWNPQMTLGNRTESLLFATRAHLVPLLGALFAWISWPRIKKPWPQSYMLKSAVFLTVLFVVLYLLHAWASLGNNYCVYCLQIYSMFFSFLGLLLFVLAAKRWFPNLSPHRQLASMLIPLAISVIISLQDWQEIAPHILNLQVVRIKELSLQPGTVLSSVLINNKFGLSFQFQQRIIEVFLWSLVLLFSVIMVSLVIRFVRRRVDKNTFMKHVVLIVLVTSLWLITLTISFGYFSSGYDCGEDVIASYENTGRFLSQLIPNRSKVYWLGGNSPALLTYLPDVEIFPAQLNMAYTYRLGGNPEEMLRFGSWNKALAEKWLQESDFVLLEHDKVNDGIARTFLEVAHEYHEIATSPPVLDCHPDSYIHVYERNLD